MFEWQRLRDRVAIDVLRWTPKGALTHGIGWLARRQVPRSLRVPLYTRFARRTGADLSPAALDQPLAAFPRFDDFFTRTLPQGSRPIASGDDVAVSPCDGVLSEAGITEGGRILQCKGRDYTLRGLLADEAEARAFEGGAYATLYLAPRNYHRVHAPTGDVVTGYRHIPGAFFPVNPISVRHVAGLFSINERLVTYMSGPLGRVAVVMVAATGVGHITVSYDAVETHRRGTATHGWAQRYATPRPLAKGGELGTFHLGSTVILLFQPGRVTLAGLERGRPVRVGEALGRRAAGRSGEVAA
ncbi:MAG: phosphatidylserine decarboxylase [Myxococcales bacterium]|nr:phosphatidylserine decarboxylase [Myxococcales bacterium]